MTTETTMARGTGAPPTPAAYSRDDEIRAAMPRFRPLTLLIGKPYPGERPMPFTPTTHLVTSSASLVLGTALSAGAVLAAGWWLVLLVPGWAVTLHGARNLRMMIYHQCAHRNMWRRARADAVLGRLIAGLLLVQSFERYKTEHVAEHHARHHMTLRDPTVQAFLIGLGLDPGMTRRRMWRTVIAKLVSPRYHARFFWARLRSYWQQASRRERVATVAGHAVPFALAAWLNAWPVLLLAWLLPLTVFFQVSNTLRLCVKHTFPPRGEQEQRSKEHFAGLTNSIFFGDVPPRPGPGSRRAWARWWLRLVTVHFPCRYLVLTGDTICHDYHHRRPMDPGWARYIHARQADIDAGHAGWPPYKSVWGGLVPAINTVFDSLAAADPGYYDPARLAQVNQRELFTAFDD
ncbi:fatty acid desaturase [Spongiactinospora sp. TRM90649]|uniref:fatty acid desaturase n=1 Tax=Spongiactinospora sp. TRM90649 TaxID=3031114 RepID=UPI0023F8ABCE|nr:fatty acid desaturase [Spongiactinospora sp. TRM90649]MDF5753261.1 fatty acid desaturase [Spongiactinospora sp. TRM90649]